jgi:glycosyltransferase involved in cell wall biosynthesis
MSKITVNYIFRKRGEGHNSIEELFQSIITHLPDEVEARVVELPYGGASLKSVLGNLWHVLFLKGIIHVTGDVYYIGLLPFKKTVLTVHDANILQLTGLSRFKKWFIKWFWYQLPLVMAKQLTVISNFTKLQVVELYKGALKKTAVIYNPVNPLLHHHPKNELSQPPMLLHIGTKAHKNLERTIEAVYKCGYQLSIVGPLNDSQKNALETYPISYQHIVNTNFEGITALYEACDVVSFVSYLEGFGMPVIEAQQVGRPVVAGNRCSIPEVGGDGALYVDPDDVDAIAGAYKKIVEDKDFRRQLIENGRNNVKRFDINAITTEYCNLYRQLLSNET